MEIEKEKRDILIRLIRESGSLSSEVYYTLKNLDLFIDKREGSIQEILR